MAITYITCTCVLISSVQANSTFIKEITNAQFYYLDKFLLLTSGNGLYLYKYYIDTTKPDDIKRCNLANIGQIYTACRNSSFLQISI